MTNLESNWSIFTDVQLLQRWDKAEKVVSLAEEEISAVLKEAPSKSFIIEPFW